MENLTELLEKLADKLGTTTEYLWGVLIKQAQIEIYIFIVVFLLSMLGVYITIKLLKSTQKYWDKEDAPMSAWLALSFGVVVGIATLIGVLSSIANISDVITAITNPEYWALQEVFSVIK